MHKSAIAQRFFVIVFILLISGCGGSLSVQVNELSSNTVSYDETIHINNCGGKADSEQTASRSFATTIEGGAEFSAGYQSIVEGGVSAKYSQYRNISKSQRLIAPPATNMEFVLRWSEDIHAGNVTVDGTTGNYEVRVPVAVEQVSSQDLICDNHTATPAITEATNWAITFEYPFPTGFWLVGTHEYTLQEACPNIEDGSGVWANAFSVSESAQLLSGDVYLRIAGLKDKPIFEGSKSVEIIHPMQTTIAALTISEISQSDAELAFRDCTITVIWDGGEPKQLMPGLPFERQN